MRIFLAALLLSVGGVAAAADAPRPHMVFMMADDLGWGDVGFHGSVIRTPNIDRLVERGVELSQFYVQPVCSPTRASLMTGRYPMRYGLQCGVVRPWDNAGLPHEERTLATALSEVGYATAIVGKWHLGHFAPGDLPTRRGFDHQYGHYNGAIDYFELQRDGGHDWHRDDQTLREEGYSTELLGDEAVRIIRQHNQEQPLFLYVPFNAPHGPYQAPQAAIDAYQNLPQGNRRIFAAMVTCMDEAIGRIVAAFDESGYPREHTLLFFCSDNGGIRKVGSNRELRGGKDSLYEGGVRVPAVMVWDGTLPAGSIVDEPLHIVDMLPTLVGLAGGQAEAQKPLDGRDAWATISQGAPSPHAENFILHNLTPFHAAIRMGPWKLIRNGKVRANDTEGPAEDTWELYNIREDISEKQNLVDEYPDVVARLKKQLAQLDGEQVIPDITPNRPPEGFQVPEVWGEFDDATAGAR